MEYKQEGRLTIAELGGQIYVANEANVEHLRGFIEKGANVQLNPTTNKKTGEPWVWVNPPQGNPFTPPSTVGRMQCSTPNEQNVPKTCLQSKPLTLNRTMLPTESPKSEPTQTLQFNDVVIPGWAKVLDTKLDEVLAWIKKVESIS